MTLRNIVGINWLLLRVQSGGEDKIKKEIDEAFSILKNNIEEREKNSEEIDKEDLLVSERLLSISIPKISVDVLLKDGSRKKEEKCAFSGYIFVEIDAKDGENIEKIIIMILSFLRSVLKKISIISSKSTGDIKVLKPGEFQKMIDKIKETSEKKMNQKYIQKGSYVKIINGRLSATKAKVFEVDYDRGLVKVVFNLFGNEMVEECAIEDVKVINLDDEDIGE